MATQATKRKSMAPIAAAIALLFALLGGVLAFSNQALANYVPVTEDKIAHPNYLFDSGLKLDPNADTSGFSVSITKDGQEVEPPTGLHDIPADAEAAYWPYRSKTEWENNRYGFFTDSVGRTVGSVSFWFDDPKALDDATITITYPYIGTYNGEAIGMTATVTNVEFMRHPFSAAATHVENTYSWETDTEGNVIDVKEDSYADTYVTGPAMTIAKLPQFGIFQWNIHQDDFDIKFYKTAEGYQSIEGAPLTNLTDIFFTYNSLSVYTSYIGSGFPNMNGVTGWPDGWNGSAYRQHERVKALSDISDAFIVQGSNVYTDEGTGKHGDNDRYASMSQYTELKASNGKTYYPQKGTIWVGGSEGYTSTPDDDASWPYYWTESENGFVDTVGDDAFTKNSVSFNFADSSDIRFRMNTPDNSFWFTIYPQVLTDAFPGDPTISVTSKPWKGISASEEEALEDGAKSGVVKVGDAVSYTVDQQVNAIGQDALTRYEALKMAVTIPSGVAIDAQSLTIKRDMTSAEKEAAGESAGTTTGLPESAGEFSTTTDANGDIVITYTFNRDFLKGDMPMQGEHYYITVDGTISAGTEGQALEASAKTVFNTPSSEDKDAQSVSEGGRVGFSNPNAIVNVLDGEGDESKLTLANRFDTFYYSVSQEVPADAVSIEISDKLEDVLEVVDAKLYAAGEELKTVAGFIEVNIDGQNVTAFVKDNTASDAPITEQYATAVRGKNVTLVIAAKIKDTVTDEELLEKYGNTTNIPNVATVTINNDPNTTNEVLVTPPNLPVKKVEGDLHYTLSERDAAFNYTITHKVPETLPVTKDGETKNEEVTSLVFSDTLDPALNFASETVTVSAGGEEIASFPVAADAEKIEFTLDGDTLAKAKGKEITIAFKAVFDPEVTDEEVLKVTKDEDINWGVIYEGSEDGSHEGVPNAATFTYKPENGSEIKLDTNTVTVERPEEPTKLVNGEIHYDLSAVQEEFTYTVSQKVPTNAESMVFTDTLEPVLEFVGEASVDKGEGVATVDGQTLTFTMGDVTGLRGEVVTLAFKAKISEGADLSDYIVDEVVKIPNTAKVAINNNPAVETNPVTVTPPDEPEKFINGQKELVELETRDESFVYTVTQKVPEGAVKIVITDELEDVLVIEEASIDLDGATVEVSGNTVTATAEDTKDAKIVTDARGNVVTLTIKAVIRDDISDSDLIAKYGSTIIPNQATVSINDKQGMDTNIVEVTPPPSEEEPVKKVNGQTGLVSLEKRDEVFTYTVEQYIPLDAKSATFTDTLEDVLEIVGTPSLDAAGASVEVKGNTVSATLEGDALKAVWAKTLTLTIEAKIKNDVTDAQLIEKYGSLNVPNKAEVTIDGKGKATNVVEVTPPDSPREDPEKFINGQKELVTLASRPETFVYEVAQVLPAGAKNVVFEDTLEDVLEIVDAPSMNVKDADVEIVVEGNKVIATLEDASAYQGEKLVLTINAQIRDSVTDADLIAKYGSTVVPNKATVTINNEPKTTNEVQVTPPPEDKEIVKTVNGQAHADLETAEEVFTYELAVAVPADADKVNIFDTLVDELEFVGGVDAISVQVDGKDIEATKTIDGQKLEVEVVTYKAAEAPAAEAAASEDATEAANDEAAESTPAAEEATTDEAAADATVLTTGEAEAAAEEATEEAPAEEATETADGIDLRAKTIVVSFQAKIRSGADLSKYFDATGNARVPNTGSYIINDDPGRSYESNPVTVTPPAPPVDEPEKFINGQKELVELADRADTFTYTVSQKVPANAVTLVFEDTLEDVLEIVDGARIDGKAIYTITAEGNRIVATTEDATADRGAVVTLTIVAKIKDGVTDDELIAKYGSTRVPNVATVTVNGNPKVTNTVLVTPPPAIEIEEPPTPNNPPVPEEPPTPEEPIVPNEPETPNNPPTTPEDPKTPVPPVTSNPPTPATPTPGITSAPKTADASAPFVAGLAGLAIVALIGGLVSYSRSRKEEVVVPRGSAK